MTIVLTFTPLQDEHHSNTQVLVRFVILQAVLAPMLIVILLKVR